MSRINFDTLLREKPDLGPVWLAVRAWAETPKHSRYFDPRDVAPSLQRQGIQPRRLFVALQELVERGWLVQVYKAWSPADRVVIGGEYDSPSDVPDHVRGPLDEPVPVEPANIIPLFREGT